MKKQKNVPVGEGSLPALDADGQPKLSRRLKIQNKIEKKNAKALADGVAVDGFIFIMGILMEKTKEYVEIIKNELSKHNRISQIETPEDSDFMI